MARGRGRRFIAATCLKSTPPPFSAKGHTKLTKEAKRTKSAHDPPDTIPEQSHVEVHEERQPLVRKLQVRERLRFMEARQRLDRLDLDDDRFGHKQVEP